jgi:hypothetical protein
VLLGLTIRNSDSLAGVQLIIDAKLVWVLIEGFAFDHKCPTKIGREASEGY